MLRTDGAADCGLRPWWKAWRLAPPPPASARAALAFVRSARAFRARIDHIASVAPRRQKAAGVSRPPLPSPRRLPGGSSAFGGEGRMRRSHSEEKPMKWRNAAQQLAAESDVSAPALPDAEV